MVDGIRNVEEALGDGIKRVMPSEVHNKIVGRKSLVAGCFIKKGEIFSINNLVIKRPGSGLSPILWDEVVGVKSPRDFEKDELIEL